MITGKNCKIGNLKIVGKGEIILGNDVVIGDNVVINISENLGIGDRSIIGDYFLIAGRDIKIGREFWSGRFCEIGGGSCFEKLSSLRIGDQCHLGNNGMINTARPVIIGDEVGMGEETKIYTHGAYLNYLYGFPVEFGMVKIGDKVWLPKAIVMPNVTIEDNVVVGAGAIVTKSLPSGCLAMGIPAKIVKENCYPKPYTEDEIKELINKFVDHFVTDIAPEPIEIKTVNRRVYLNGCMTLFDFKDMKIDGKATELTELFRNECRRFGIRFKYYPDNGVYRPW